MKKKILVLDDEESFSTECIEALSKFDELEGFNIESINDQYEKCINEIISRRIKSRDGDFTINIMDIDQSDIIIIDYDLSMMKKFGNISGAELSYLIKTYSLCDIVLELNHYNEMGQNYFDLTLMGHYESHADYDLSSEHLKNPVLWGEDNEFNPWYWQSVFSFIDKNAQRIKDLETNKEKNILEILNLDSIKDIIPISVMQYLGSDPSNLKIDDFLYDSGAVNIKDSIIDSLKYKIAASKLSKWLENILLPCQDVLIDAPHLVMQYPSLLNTDDYEKEENWNKVTIKKYDKLDINKEIIKDYKYEKDFWVSKPVWYWNGIINEDKIDENEDPYSRVMTNFVFCEDVSKFYPISETTLFECACDTAYKERYIKDLSYVSYIPEVRKHVV